MKTHEKDPDAVKDYSTKWLKWLDGDTISTSIWTADSGISIDSDTNDTDSTTVWLSGGTDGCQYRVTNRITTAGGRTEDRTKIIKVREQ